MVKEKPNSIRTYDADGFRKRAACLCVRDETEQEVGTISCSSLFLLWPGPVTEPDGGRLWNVFQLAAIGFVMFLHPLKRSPSNCVKFADRTRVGAAVHYTK